MLKLFKTLARLYQAGVPVAHAVTTLAAAIDPALAPMIAVLSDPKNQAALESLAQRIEADFLAHVPTPPAPPVPSPA